MRGKPRILQGRQIFEFLGVLGGLGGSIIIVLASLGGLGGSIIALVVFLAVQLFLRIRSITEVVEWPGRRGMEYTAPPQLFTSLAPTIASGFQSPPFTSTSGFTARMSPSGVSSSNQVTSVTASSAASTGLKGLGSIFREIGVEQIEPGAFERL